MQDYFLTVTKYKKMKNWVKCFGSALLMICSFLTVWAGDEENVIDSCASYELVGNNVYDFGDVDIDGGPFSATFKVVSTGKIPMIVLSGSTQCPCTKITYSQDIIEPGDTLEIVVTFSPFTTGGINQSCVLSTNTYPHNHLWVYIKANVVESEEKNTKKRNV